jgi:hypothetical protein
MCRQLSPGYPLRRIAAPHLPSGLATVNAAAVAGDRGEWKWKLCFAKMNRGDCGMVKNAKGIVKAETLLSIANLNF